MKSNRPGSMLAVVLTATFAIAATFVHAADPLPSWNEGEAKQSIV